MSKHHFVPKMYMRLFNGGQESINVYNINLGKLIKGSSIRGQCQRNNFHGGDNRIEEYLCGLEGEWSKTLKEVIICGKIVCDDTKSILLQFIAFQILRTHAYVDGQQKSFVNLIDYLFQDDEFVDFGGDLVSRADALSVIDDRLKSPIFGDANKYAMMLHDLQMSLLVSPQENFAFSDNPVIRYNKAFEFEYSSVGNRGIASRGLMIFCPISPKLCLFLYDAAVYKVRMKNITNIDVSKINAMQYCNGLENIYFGNYDINIDDLNYIGGKYRKDNANIVEIVSQNSDFQDLVSRQICYTFKEDFEFLEIRNRYKRKNLRYLKNNRTEFLRDWPMKIRRYYNMNTV